MVVQANLGKGILDEILQYLLANGKEFRAPSSGFTLTLNRTRFYMPARDAGAESQGRLCWHRQSRACPTTSECHYTTCILLTFKSIPLSLS